MPGFAAFAAQADARRGVAARHARHTNGHMDTQAPTRYRRSIKPLRAPHAPKPEKSKTPNMTRLSLVLGLLACGAVPAAVHAQSAAHADDARACATQTGPAAIAACTHAIASRLFGRSDLALLHYRRAVLLREANEPDRAIADATTAIHLNGDAIPMSADAFNLRISQRNAYALRGHAFADKRDYDHALADFEALLATDPRDVSARMARADILAQQDACERAVADYDAALALDPKASDGFLGRARCRAKLGDRDRAIADYRAALAAGVPDALRPLILTELQKLGGAP
jgi:tetratricopeptide (TPR) repeat protein